MGRDFTGPDDMKDHMEEIRIHLRGHNLYDIFYGPYKEREKELLQEYIRLASISILRICGWRRLGNF